MNDQFTRQAQDFFAAAKDARIPENVQAFAEDSVAKTREAFSKMNAVAKDGVKVFEDVMLATHAGAKTFPEVARLQQTFMQQQLAIASNQTKELFELSAKVTQQTFETINSAAAKSFEQLKKVG